MKTTPTPNPHGNSVIPTGVEEPAVRLLRQTSCSIGKSVALVPALALILLWTPGLAVTQTTSASEPDAQKQLDNLATLLANGSVASIDILHMPDRMETRASVGPENLDKWWECRVTINKINEWAGRNDLLETMKSTRLLSNSRMSDLRSAVVFNDSRGKRIGVLYFGRYFGRYIGQFGGAEGSIGNTPVKFKGDLATWLKHMIPSSLQ